MIERWLVAALHLLALPIGFAGIWMRASTLRQQDVSRALKADAAWGIAALIWISTGLWRALGTLEKGTDYYLRNHVFWAKMGLLLLVLLLEVWPMITLIRWRVMLGSGRAPDLRHARTFATISFVQAALVVAMIVAATGMARGVRAR